MTVDQMHQFKLMADRLAAFEKGDLALSVLVADLENLFHSLNVNDSDWEAGFWENWGDLEIAYAVALNRQLKQLSTASMQNVQEAVTNLKSLVASKMGALA